MTRLTSCQIASIVAQNQRAPLALQNPAIDEMAEEIELMRLDGAAELARLRSKIRLLTMSREEWRAIAQDAVAHRVKPRLELVRKAA